MLAYIGIDPHDLAAIVDAHGLTGRGVKDTKCGEYAGVIEKALTVVRLINVGPDDLAAVVDA